MSDIVKILDQKELELMNAYWRAANYLSVGQIYLLDNLATFFFSSALSSHHFV